MQKEEELKLDRCMFAVSGTRLLLTFIACEVERRGQGSFPRCRSQGSSERWRKLPRFLLPDLELLIEIRRTE